VIKIIKNFKFVSWQGEVIGEKGLEEQVQYSRGGGENAGQCEGDYKYDT